MRRQQPAPDRRWWPGRFRWLGRRAAGERSSCAEHVDHLVGVLGRQRGQIETRGRELSIWALHPNSVCLAGREQGHWLNALPLQPTRREALPGTVGDGNDAAGSGGCLAEPLGAAQRGPGPDRSRRGLAPTSHHDQGIVSGPGADASTRLTTSGTGRTVELPCRRPTFGPRRIAAPALVLRTTARQELSNRQNCVRVDLPPASVWDRHLHPRSRGSHRPWGDRCAASARTARALSSRSPRPDPS